MSILVLTTGGTMGAMPYKDLKRPPATTLMPAKGQDFVRTALQKIPTKIRYVSLEARDSKEIDEAYRQLMLDTVKQAPEKMILITHGTDTILDTAAYFYKQATMQTVIKDKTIILTGSMVPLSCGEKSDGLQNLRFSLRQLEQGQIMRGVYIVLCDFQDEDAKTGWGPRLYRFEPGRYQKYYDREDAQRSRLQRVSS
jgi:L-asparaginase